jgi:Protein of unknown function (DUF3137)
VAVPAGVVDSTGQNSSSLALVPGALAADSTPVIDYAPLLMGLFAVGVVALLVGAFLLDRKRRERIMTFCLARGWQYVAEDPSLADRWQGEPFGLGDRRRARNVMRGNESGRDFVAFDYSYETHSTDSKGNRTTSTHPFAVTAVTIPAYLPRLEVSPAGAFGRLTDAVGLTNDIELESEDFNRAFKVHAEDRKFATDVLSPRTMQYLLTAPRAAWRIQGSTMLRWTSGRTDPANVIVDAAVLDQVADGIPAFVWKDHQGQPGYDPQT